MTRRPRLDDDLFEALEDKKENPNENIGDVLTREFPEIEQLLENGSEEETNKLEDLF